MNSTIAHSSDSSTKDWQKFAIWSMAALTINLMIIMPAMAVDASPMGYVLCRVVFLIYGEIGRGLATLAIIIVGVGATLGKVSWGLAVTVAVGISIMFQAGTIVNLLLNGSSTNSFGIISTTVC